MDVITYSCIIIVLSLILYLVNNYINKDKDPEIPGPKTNKTGKYNDNLEDIAKAGGLHPYLMKLHAKYGPIVKLHMPKPVVSIASHQLFKEQSRTFDRALSFFTLFEHLLTPHSIQYANGDGGRRRHAAYSRCFHQQTVNSHIDKIEENVDSVISRLDKCNSADYIAASEMAFAFSIQGVLTCAFGMDIKAKTIIALKHDYLFVWETLENSMRGIQIIDGSELKQNLDEKIIEIHNFIKNIIGEADKRLRKGDPNENLIIDVISTMNLTDDEKMADLLTIFVGGLHTTAYLLIWIIYYLANSPRIQEKMHKEIEEFDSKTTKLSIEKLSEMTYVRQVIDETLRCVSIAPVAARVNNESDLILGGYKVPSGTPVIHALGVSLQDPKIWPNPEKFDPERFSPENRKKIPSYGFEPFGTGKRKCPGYNFSMVEATMFLYKLIKKYKLKLGSAQNGAERVYGLVTHPKEEIFIQIQRRK